MHLDNYNSARYMINKRYFRFYLQIKLSVCFERFFLNFSILLIFYERGRKRNKVKREESEKERVKETELLKCVYIILTNCK